MKIIKNNKVVYDPDLHKKDKFFLCSCDSEGILVTDFFESPDYKEEEDSDVFFSMFHYGYPKPYSLWQRIKYAFWHLKTGETQHNEIVLSNKKAKELGEYLIERSSIK